MGEVGNNEPAPYGAGSFGSAIFSGWILREAKKFGIPSPKRASSGAEWWMTTNTTSWYVRKCWSLSEAVWEAYHTGLADVVFSDAVTPAERRLILFAAAYATNDQVTMVALAIEATTENDSVDED